jgi:hypothetical protein
LSRKRPRSPISASSIIAEHSPIPGIVINQRKKHKHVARVRWRASCIAVYALLHDGVLFAEKKSAAV